MPPNTQSPLLTMLDVPNIDTSKMASSGVGTDKDISAVRAELIQAKEDYAKSLEDRYANPNWFKIAGAFAKPQLGGFLASLGSAADVMGETTEQQRAVAPTVAKMKAENQVLREDMIRKERAEQVWNKWKKDHPKEPPPPNVMADMEYWSPGSSQAVAGKLFQEATGKAITNTKAAVEAENSNPMIDTIRLVYGGKEATPEEIAERQQKIVANRPPQIDEAEWSTLPVEQKMARQAQYAKDQALMGLSETQKDAVQAKAAFDTLPMLHTIRDLAMGTGIKNGREDMAKALNYFGGNSPFDAIAKAASEGRLANGKLEGFDQYARQMNMSPEVRDNFQKLVKLLADYQVRSVNASQNPTDAYSALKQQGSPNIGNSQRALVTLTDLLGHTEKHSLDRYSQTMNVPALKRIEALKPLEKAYSEEHAKIAISNPFEYAPSWYNPSSPSPVAAPARQTAPAAAPAAGGAPAAAISLDDIRAARAALAARNQKPPQ